VPDGVLEHVAIVEVGRLVVPFALVTVSATKIGTGHERLPGGDAKLGLEGEGLVPTVFIGRAAIDENDGYRARALGRARVVSDVASCDGDGKTAAVRDLVFFELLAWIRNGDRKGLRTRNSAVSARAAGGCPERPMERNYWASLFFSGGIDLHLGNKRAKGAGPSDS
jgi:hypothetical protein